MKKEEVRDSWNKYVLKYKNDLTFQNKPIISVYLTSSPFSIRKFLILKVNWNPFIKYLEDKAKSLIKLVMMEGNNIMMVYQDIWFNFLKIIKEIRSKFEPYILENTFESFKKLITITGDYPQIEETLIDLEELIDTIERSFEKYRYVQLYTIKFKMNVRNIHNLIEELNIVAIYFVLRNLLEDFIRFFIYLDFGNRIVKNPDLVLSSMFIYDYQAPLSISLKKFRIYSLKEFKREFHKKFLRAVDEILSKNNEVISVFDITDKLINIKMRVLGIKKGSSERLL